MTEPKITVYGTYSCPACRNSKMFLGEHQIPYRWVSIDDDAEAERFVMEKTGGRRTIPTIVFEDGSFLVQPSVAELAAQLGLKTEASRSHYDLIVIGGGPAGLTAALYTAREAIDTLVIERAAFGGQAAGTERVDNMPGFPDGVTGTELSQRLRRQAERFGVELLQVHEIAGISRRDDLHAVRTSSGGEYTARSLLIATGSHYRRLGAPGETDYLGAGVHFCATCDGPFYKGKHVAVIGGGNSAAEESLFLTKFADHVTILVRGKELRATHLIQEEVFNHPSIEVRFQAQVKAFLGSSSRLTHLKVLDARTGREENLEVDGVFVFIGLIPNTRFLEGRGVLLDPWGFVLTGHDLPEQGRNIVGYKLRPPYMLETSLPGVFAAGDVRKGSTKQVVSAAGEGAAAALAIRDYLKRR
ncbi:MAG: FAD-dependent oxidoreductase [Syntrophobacteraceae bacterium]|jgi:thioredoxin reductase (NADPH)|nr:FAD-dependent oxidoreductase [Syntrophobacteraceae bacterium]